MITLDGSEGGGQILRTALGLSTITKLPFTLSSVRGGRDNPGLRVQHLEALNAIALLCDADVKGADLGSTNVTFAPGKIRERTLEVEITTAGSAGLIFQTLQLIPYVIKKPVEVRINGGATYGKWAPPVQYLEKVFLPTMRKFFYEVVVDINKNGFYPKGGAEVTFVFEPWTPTPITLTDRGKLKGVHVLSVASNALEESEVCERQAKAAKHLLNAEGFKARDESSYVDALNPGCGVVCWAEYENTVLGGDCIGERGVRAEDVGRNAAKSLLEAMKSNCALDRHASDMILPFVALAGGEVLLAEMTDHVKTNLATIEMFLEAKFEVDKNLIRTRSP